MKRPNTFKPGDVVVVRRGRGGSVLYPYRINADGAATNLVTGGRKHLIGPEVVGVVRFFEEQK